MSPLGAVEAISVVDNGRGISPETARESFKEWGDSWKEAAAYSPKGRVLMGKEGEGRFYTYSLGDSIRWDSVANDEDGRRVRTIISVDLRRPTIWNVTEPLEVDEDPGTTVWIDVPQRRSPRSLTQPEAAFGLVSRLAPYLMAYPDVKVTFDGELLNFADAIARTHPVPFELPEAEPDPHRVVELIEWKSRAPLRQLLIEDSLGRTICSWGSRYSDAVMRFTPVLTSSRFDGVSGAAAIDLAIMQNSDLLQAVDAAVRAYLFEYTRAVAGKVIDNLDAEGLYPYDRSSQEPLAVLERQTFDMVVTIARDVLPDDKKSRKLTVNLIKTALENDPGSLRRILGQVLELGPEQRDDFDTLLTHTELPKVIGAVSVVTNRLKFIESLRSLLATPEQRLRLREVDQLHPMVNDQLWLFGEDWTLSRKELGLTGVYREHLRLLAEDVGEVIVEGDIPVIRQSDGRSGRVDIVMYRRMDTEHSARRLVIELKRPSLKVGNEEVAQIKRYARALVKSGSSAVSKPCKWDFYLITHEWLPEIEDDIRQLDWPPGLLDKKENYNIWVKSWAEILDAADSRLAFFRDQLEFEASDEVVTTYMSERHEWYVPSAPHVVDVSGDGQQSLAVDLGSDESR